MDTRQMGVSGLKVSRFGLGTMTFGSEADESTSYETLDVFVEAGGTLLDTADNYGRGASEYIIGRWLETRPGQRERIVLATKKRFDYPCASLTPAYLRTAIDASLARLCVEQIDIYQLHGPDNEHRIDEIVEFLAEIVTSGKARYVGVSNNHSRIRYQSGGSMIDRPGLSAAAVQELPTLTADPAGTDLAALGWLDAVIDGARVVAIGESAHFNTESYRLRHLMLRYLVERHGFTAYAMESGFVEGLRVDAWLDRPADQAAAEIGAVLATGMTSLMGMWADQRQLLEWMRAVNAGGQRLRFYGVDTPGSNVSLEPALALVSAHLAAADPRMRLDPELRELVSTTSASSVFAATGAVTAYANLPEDRKDALTAGLALLLSRLRARRPGQRFDGAVGDRAFDEVERALQLAVALDAYRRDMTINVRDLAQADTVEWILRHEDRIVLAAHNAHVQRWPAEFPGVLPRVSTAGQHLDIRLGRQYRVIGVTNGSGETLTADPAGFAEGRFFDQLSPAEPDTLDALMAATHHRPFGVDLRRLDDQDRATLASVHTQRSGGFSCPIDPLTAYDAIVHLPEVTAAQPDTDAVDAAPPEVAAAFRRWSTP